MKLNDKIFHAVRLDVALNPLVTRFVSDNSFDTTSCGTLTHSKTNCAIFLLFLHVNYF